MKKTAQSVKLLLATIRNHWNRPNLIACLESNCQASTGKVVEMALVLGEILKRLEQGPNSYRCGQAVFSSYDDEVSGRHGHHRFPHLTRSQLLCCGASSKRSLRSTTSRLSHCSQKFHRPYLETKQRGNREDYHSYTANGRFSGRVRSQFNRETLYGYCRTAYAG